MHAIKTALQQNTGPSVCPFAGNLICILIAPINRCIKTQVLLSQLDDQKFAQLQKVNEAKLISIQTLMNNVRLSFRFFSAHHT